MSTSKAERPGASSSSRILAWPVFPRCAQLHRAPASAALRPSKIITSFVASDLLVHCTSIVRFRDTIPLGPPRQKVSGLWDWFRRDKVGRLLHLVSGADVLSVSYSGLRRRGSWRSDVVVGRFRCRQSPFRCKNRQDWHLVEVDDVADLPPIIHAHATPRFGRSSQDEYEHEHEHELVVVSIRRSPASTR